MSLRRMYLCAGQARCAWGVAGNVAQENAPVKEWAHIIGLSFDMHTRLRRVCSGLLAVLLLSGLAGASFEPGKALAESSTNTLIINEINWGGSSLDPLDDWIEFKNISLTDPINFAVTNYSFDINSNRYYLTAGIVPASGYFVVKNLATSSIGTAGVQSENPMDIPSTGFQIKLNKDSSIPVDVAGDGLAGSQFAGFADLVAGQYASMSRKANITSGDLATSWFTPKTTGSEYAGTYDNKIFGTPKADNVEVFVPDMTSIVINPTPTAKVGESISITGSTIASNIGATDNPGILETLIVEKFDPAVPSNTVVLTSPAAIIPAINNFAVTPFALASEGIHRLTFFTSDLAGNRSAYYQYFVKDTPQGYLTVTPADPLTNVDKPMLLPLVNCDYTVASGNSCVTSQNKINISGKVKSGDEVVVAINGVNIKTATPGSDVDADGNVAFSVTDLTLTSTPIPNTIDVRAARVIGLNRVYSEPVFAYVKYDATAPVLNEAKVVLTQEPSGTADTVSGSVAAVTDNILTDGIVNVYSDQALTNKIASGPVKADGSFDAIAIGDNVHSTVYLQVIDLAKNISNVVSKTNIIDYAIDNVVMTVAATADQTTAIVKWQAVGGATGYWLKWRRLDSSFGDPVLLCQNTATCPFSTTITGLTSGTTYVVAMAAVDGRNQQSNFTESRFMTTTPPVVVTSSVTNNVASTTTTPSSTYTYKSPAPTATPQVSATPSPTPTPDSGEVKSTTTEESNWTPWIILAILVGLAVLATTGYFYWFGGEAGEQILATVGGKDDEDDDEDITPPVSKPKPQAPKTETKSSDVKPKNKDKRW